MTVVEVLVKPNCVQCVATKRWLDQHDVPYTATDDPERLDHYRQLGALTAPVVVFPSGEWVAGFRPDRLTPALALA